MHEDDMKSDVTPEDILGAMSSEMEDWTVHEERQEESQIPALVEVIEKANQFMRACKKYNIPFFVGIASNKASWSRRWASKESNTLALCSMISQVYTEGREVTPMMPLVSMIGMLEAGKLDNKEEE